MLIFSYQSRRSLLTLRVLALSALLVDSKAKASASTSAVVRIASAFSTGDNTNNWLLLFALLALSAALTCWVK